MHVYAHGWQLSMTRQGKWGASEKIRSSRGKTYGWKGKSLLKIKKWRVEETVVDSTQKKNCKIEGASMMCFVCLLRLIFTNFVLLKLTAFDSGRERNW